MPHGIDQRLDCPGGKEGRRRGRLDQFPRLEDAPVDVKAADPQRGGNEGRRLLCHHNPGVEGAVKRPLPVLVEVVEHGEGAHQAAHLVPHVNGLVEANWLAQPFLEGRGQDFGAQHCQRKVHLKIGSATEPGRAANRVGRRNPKPGINLSQEGHSMGQVVEQLLGNPGRVAK